VEALIRLQSLGGVVVGHQSSGSEDGYIVSVTQTQLIVELFNGLEKVRVESSQEKLDASYHHIAFTLKDGTVSAYIDGELFGTAAFKSHIRLQNPVLYFGRAARTPGGYKGELSEVRLWNKART
jgi:hypothetical protein